MLPCASLPRATSCKQLALASPGFNSDTLDGAEVRVAGYQREIVLLGAGVAIQMSFSGIGRPFARSNSRIIP